MQLHSGRNYWPSCWCYNTNVIFDRIDGIKTGCCRENRKKKIIVVTIENRILTEKPYGLSKFHIDYDVYNSNGIIELSKVVNNLEIIFVIWPKRVYHDDFTKFDRNVDFCKTKVTTLGIIAIVTITLLLDAISSVADLTRKFAHIADCLHYARSYSCKPPQEHTGKRCQICSLSAITGST